jgi:hypothetical protein
LQIMMWPIVDADFSTESYKKFGMDRYLTTSTMKWMYDMYIPDPQNAKTYTHHLYVQQLNSLRDYLLH